MLAGAALSFGFSSQVSLAALLIVLSIGIKQVGKWKEMLIFVNSE
jgi:hypothetical protein